MVRTGTKMTHVPFRARRRSCTDLMAGRIDVSNSTLPSVLGQIQGGEIRAIGLASPQRNARHPGRADPARAGHHGRGRRILDRLLRAGKRAEAGARHALRHDRRGPEQAGREERIAKLGFTLTVRNPDAFRPYLAQEIQTWADIIKAANIET